MPFRRPSAPALAAALLAAFASLAFAQTYTAWRSANFTSDELSNPAISGPGADPDGDGIANLHEFVFVGAPKIADTGISPILERIEGVLAFTYRERHGLATSGVRVNLEVSDTLQHWITPNTVIEAAREAFAEEGLDLVTLLDPVPPVSGANPRRFLRLRADTAASSTLKAPTAVGIKPVSPTLYEISWNDWNRDETGHRVERLASAGSTWEPLGTVAADVNFWQHVGADYRDGFTYRVAALRGETVANSAPASLPDDDGDGIPNFAELGSSYAGAAGTYPTSPYEFSSGGSGVSDLWAIENGFDPFIHDFSVDTDQDGLSDYEEAMRGTDPHSADSDGDGVLDSEDGWPRVAWITVPPLPELRYAVVPLRQKGWPATATVSQIDDQGNVLGRVPTSTNPKGLYLGLDAEQPVDVPVIPALSADNRMLVCGVSHLLAGLAPGGTVFGHVEITLPETTPGPYSWNAYLHGVRAAMWDPVTNIVTELSLPSLPSGMRTQGFNLSGGVTLTRGGKRLEVREFIGSSREEVAIFFDGELISYDGLDEDVGLDGKYRLLVNDDGFAAGVIVAYPSLALIDYSGNVWENGQATRLNFSPDILTSSDAERGYPTVVAGWHNTDGRFFWARRQAAQDWPEELCAPWDPATQSPVILSSIVRTGPLGYVGQPLANDRLELIVGDKLIRNGVVRPLADLLPEGWASPFARDINNHGVILAEAKRTIDAAGLPIPTAAQVSEPVLLVPYYLAQAEGENAGKPLRHGAAVYEPDDGVDRGEPIYHPVKNNLALSFPAPLTNSTIDTLHCVLWGEALSLTETSASSGVFQTSTADLIITLPHLPLLDGGVLEHLTAVVHSPARALHNAAYSLEETTATSSQFEDRIVSASVKIGAFSDQTVDEVQLRLTDDLRHTDITLTETAPASGVFAKDGTTLSLIGAQTGPAPTAASLTVTVSAGAFGLSNTTLVLDAGPGGAGEYRNQPPPTPTNAPPSTAPAHAKWKLKIGLPPEVATALGLKWATAEGERSISLETSADSLGYSTSENAFIVVPHTVTAPLLEGAQTLPVRIHEIDWKATVGDLKLVLGTIGGGLVAAAEKAQPQGVALQSLDRGASAGQGIDTKGRVKVPFEQMGYSMTMDLNATAQKTLAEYAPGKQIWYSLSHGATPHGYEQEPFEGLNFLGGSITADKLRPLGLDYRLVIVDGCLSAQTTFETENVAKQDETLESNSSQFARSFGPRAAYVGWAWSINTRTAQTYSAQLIQCAKDTPNIGAAHALFRDRLSPQDAKGLLLKLHEVSPGAKKEPINLTRP